MTNTIDKYETKQTTRTYRLQVFYFNGKASYCQIIKDRSTDETIDFFDREFNHIAGLVGLNDKAHNSVHPIARPLNYEKMIEVAETLSADFPFVQVDLYNLQGQIIFGEMTFYPASGYGHFTKDEFDYQLGKLFTEYRNGTLIYRIPSKYRSCPFGCSKKN